VQRGWATLARPGKGVVGILIIAVLDDDYICSWGRCASVSLPTSGGTVPLAARAGASGSRAMAAPGTAARLGRCLVLEFAQSPGRQPWICNMINCASYSIHGSFVLHAVHAHTHLYGASRA
jgi:hypothetical protein